MKVPIILIPEVPILIEVKVQKRRCHTKLKRKKRKSSQNRNEKRNLKKDLNFAQLLEQAMLGKLKQM